MKRRLRRLIVFAGVLGVLMVLNVGAALAVHDGPSPAFDEARAVTGSPPEHAAETPGAIPVGSHLLEDADGNLPPGAPGSENGFVPRSVLGGAAEDSGAIVAIANNPNCPAHYA